MCFLEVACLNCLFLVVDTRLGVLRRAASLRRGHRCRPGTRKNWSSCHRLFLQFCIYYDVRWDSPSLDDIGAFFELLVQSGRSLGTIKNYLSPVKAFYFERSLTRVQRLFTSPGWSAMVKGLSNTVRPTEDRRTAVTLEQLEVMVEFCNRDVALLPLKVALVFGFFGFLRLSNLAPPTAGEFDPSRHTSWDDVLASKDGVIIKLKWTKTLQSVKGSTPVPLPALSGSPVCPRAAWEEYVDELPWVPCTASTPLLLTTALPSGLVVTAPRLRAMFNKVAAAVGLSGEGLTPHSLRRGRATRSFLSGVPLAHIKAHGTWRSAAVEQYLLQTPRFNTPVSLAFKSSVSNN